MSTPLWSPKQSDALTQVQAWLAARSAPFFYLAGFAGTGKTTLAKHLAASMDKPVYFAAYTGKAASVLRANGCPYAQTIHSLLYSVRDSDRTRLQALLDQRAELAANDDDTRTIDWDIETLKKELKRPSFSLKEVSDVQGAGLLVLDECSMVNESMGRDILSYKVPVLVLGDPAQLPPVRGAGFFTARRPDMTLTEIHRQAADNPIILWSKVIREGGTLPFGMAGEGRATKIRRERVTDKHLCSSGAQLLTGKNATRKRLNQVARAVRGFAGTYPRAGESLVCLRNERDYGVLNGVLCSTRADAAVEDDVPDSIALDLLYEGTPMDNVPVERTAFDAYEREVAEPGWAPWMLQFDYGYCLTVHKAQGSQWDAVTVIDDGFGKWDPTLRRQWLYTAVTRAQTTLTIVT